MLDGVLLTHVDLSLWEVEDIAPCLHVGLCPAQVFPANMTAWLQCQSLRPTFLGCSVSAVQHTESVYSSTI